MQRERAAVVWSPGAAPPRLHGTCSSAGAKSQQECSACSLQLIVPESDDPIDKAPTLPEKESLYLMQDDQQKAQVEAEVVRLAPEHTEPVAPLNSKTANEPSFTRGSPPLQHRLNLRYVYEYTVRMEHAQTTGIAIEDA